MNKNTSNNLTEKEFVAGCIHAIKTSPLVEPAIVAAMDKMFTEGKWEIPDDAVTGLVSNKVNQLQSQVNSLTQLVSAMSAKLEGKPVQATGRVDAIAAAKTSKK